MADSYLNHMVDDVMSRNQGQLELEKVRETYKPIAEQTLKWYLIRKAVVREQSFKVEKEEINQFILFIKKCKNRRFHMKMFLTNLL